jgi:hypothetical protein
VLASWHLVTGEFPPAPGGVSDYTFAVAAGLAEAGESVHVWCPAAPGIPADPAGVTVHRSDGHWTAADMRAFDRALDAIPGRRRLLVQWVPHAFGRRSMNLRFCGWVASRARAGDSVDLMVHEPFLPFREGSWRQDAAAVVHRLMVWRLLRAARRTWVSIPAWATALETWAPRAMPFCWLPIPSNVAVSTSPAGASDARRRFPTSVRRLVGHFGTYDRLQAARLHGLIPQLLNGRDDLGVLLLGRHGDAFAAQFIARHPTRAARVLAAPDLPAPALSAHLLACDVLVQPYPDGASTRRSTLMAGLAHGIPTVTTRGRLTEPFWDTSPAVAMVDDDTVALVDAAHRLVDDEARRQGMSAAARTLYESRFAVRHVVERLRSDRCEDSWTA